MLCDRVLRNLHDAGLLAPAQRSPDLIDVHWHEAGLRALRKTTRGGVPLRILLPLGVALRHGDVLFEDATSLVAVEIIPTEVLVIRPRTPAEMANLALEVGNLHAPAQATEAGELLVIPDGPVEAILWRMDVPHTLDVRRFTPLAVDAMPAMGLSGAFKIGMNDNVR